MNMETKRDIHFADNFIHAAVTRREDDRGCLAIESGKMLIGSFFGISRGLEANPQPFVPLSLSLFYINANASPSVFCQLFSSIIGSLRSDPNLWAFA
jgi:hypothetical protein